MSIALPLFVFSELVFLLYWLAFYPAIMSDDSYNQWIQTKTWHFDNANPYVHTLWIWLLSLGSPTPATVIAIQLTLSALLFTVFSTWLISQSQRVGTILFFHVVLTLAPATSLYNATLWKDVTAAQFVLAMTLGWLLICTRELRFDRAGILSTIAFAVVTFMASATRHNHVVLLLVMPLLVILLNRMARNLKMLFIAIVLGLYALMQLPLLNGSIGNSQSNFFQSFPLWILTYSYQNNSPTLTEPDRLLIKSLAPNLQTASRCEFWDELFPVASQTLRNNPNAVAEVQRIFLREAARNPGMVIAQRTCNFVGNLGLQTYRWVYWDWMSAANVSVKNNVYTRDLKPDSKLPMVTPWLQGFADWSASFPWRYLFWNNAIGILAILLTAAVALYKHSGYLAGIVLIYTALISSVFFFATAVDWRYLYFLYLYSFYAIPVILVLPKLTLNQSKAA